MTLKNMYEDNSKRFIDSAEKSSSSNDKKPEIIAFKSYHAFESIGAAIILHLGRIIPKSHTKKINSFVREFRRSGISHKTAITISMLSIEYNALRNRCLYPEVNGGTIKNPKDQITLDQAKKLVSRTKGIIRSLGRAL